MNRQTDSGNEWLHDRQTSVNLQLSISSGQICESIGKSLKSIEHIAVTVSLQHVPTDRPHTDTARNKHVTNKLLLLQLQSPVLIIIIIAVTWDVVLTCFESWIRHSKYGALYWLRNVDTASGTLHLVSRSTTLWSLAVVMIRVVRPSVCLSVTREIFWN